MPNKLGLKSLSFYPVSIRANVELRLKFRLVFLRAEPELGAVAGVSVESLVGALEREGRLQDDALAVVDGADVVDRCRRFDAAWR